MASIRKLLPTIVTLQIFVAMGVTGLLSFLSVKQEVEDLIDKIIVQGSNLIQDRVTEYLATPHFFQEMNQVAILNGNLNLDELESLERYFWRQVQIGVASTSQDTLSIDEQGIEFIYYANTRGDFIGVQRTENGKSLMRIRTEQTAPNMIFYELDPQGKRSPEIQRQKYDPRERPWYKAATETRRLAWSPIYASASDGSLGINSVMPIYDNGGLLRGVLAIEITLERISDFLSGLKPSENGKAFIIDGSGKLVGTSIGEKLYMSTSEGNQQLDATQSSSPIIQAIAQKLFADYQILQSQPKKPSFDEEIDIDGDRYYIQVTSLAQELELDWLIIVVIPESDFMEKIHQNVKMTMLWSLAALAGAIIVCLLTSLWIVKPIALLNNVAHEIEGEQFTPETLVGVMKRQDELGQLARGFQQMAVKIYNREQGMKKQMDQIRLEQDQAQEASMLATMKQKSYFEDLLKKSKKLHSSKKVEEQQFNLSEILKEVKYFQGFSETDIQRLINIGYKKFMKEGESVCREDEPGDAFYIILTGNVEIYVKKINKFLTYLSEGTFFGELSLLLGIPRTATVRTTTDTLLFVVDRDGLQTLLQNYQELADKIALELHKHKAELDERQEMLTSLGLIDEDDNSFSENPLSWIRQRMTILFGV